MELITTNPWVENMFRNELKLIWQSINFKKNVPGNTPDPIPQELTRAAQP
jgi:hypothetical protein